MLTPRASRMSALPHWLDNDRLPCLATFTPAPATTKAATVEILNVQAPSPPVPQVSSSGSSVMPGLHLHGLCAHGTSEADQLVRLSRPSSAARPGMRQSARLWRCR